MQTDRSVSKEKKILIESNREKKVKITLNNPLRDNNNKLNNAKQGK